MALELQENFKGISASYWKIVDFSYNSRNNTTSVNLGLYVCKGARKEDCENFLKMEHFYFEGELKREDIYLKLKESKLEEITDETELKEIDNDGEIPEEKKYKETNKFVNAVDC